ncbi:MAG: hypothetical protein NWP83_10080 [Spirosomaceae bacterium]|nr:hypothetical protein [Spirosomataceae bacterium]
MKKLINKLWLLVAVCCFAMPQYTFSQGFKNSKLYLNEDGSHYVKFAMTGQFWLRSGNYNPGTTIFGYPKSSGTDIGIRRYRVQFLGQLTDRVFFYSQFGENNFNSISDRKLGFFVHDAMGEYSVVKTKLSLGGGLSAWSGLSRFASPSVGTIMGIDAPLYQQSTNDVTDQFLRKLSVFAKGKLGKLDYRVSMAQPMSIQKSANYNATISPIASFSGKPPQMQWNGYFQYQFKDQESNQTPYMTGTYLGTKKVCNIGAGFVYQPQAMWQQAENKVDTLYSNLLLLSADVFYDAPCGDKGEAISAYASISKNDFGPNYTRNLGVMNPANGSNQKSILNGGGTTFPDYGTGTILYAQVGYKLKNDLIGKTTLMPYASLQHSNYERLDQPMNFYDVGVNWLLGGGHTSKLTLAYQNRPVYQLSDTGSTSIIDRKGMGLLQYQVFFN